MKKKVLSIVLTVLIMALIPISVFAADGFDLSVFDNSDVSKKYDDMTGNTMIELASASDNIYVGMLDHVCFMPTVYVSDSSEYYNWEIWYSYLGNVQYQNINSVLIKIGDNRYTFDGIYNSRMDWGKNNDFHREILNVIFDGNSIPMMEDLISHRDEEIKMRFTGSNGQFDLTLSSTTVDRFIQMYELYKTAGGTREKNLEVTKLANDVQFTAKIAK